MVEKNSTKKKIVFFGCGADGLALIREISTHPKVFDDEYICFWDNNELHWGKKKFGLNVQKPYEILHSQFDFIVITSDKYFAEIREEILNKLNISSSKILSQKEYKKWKYVRFNSKDVKMERSRTSTQDRIVVYTAIFGEYDILKEPLYTSDDIDYVCYTNLDNLTSKNWQIRKISPNYNDNRRMARMIKMSPHELFSDYSISVWVDGSLLIKENIREYIERYSNSGTMICFPHSSRNCIYEEAFACGGLYLDGTDRIISQIYSYKKKRYPFQAGLYETGCIVRWHNDKKIISIMEDWKKEIEKYSIRDQISLPYCCWKNGYKPDTSDVSIYKNKWIEYVNHGLK